MSTVEPKFVSKTAISPRHILVQLTFEKMVETSVTGNLEFRTDSEHGPLSFGELDRPEDSLIVAL